MSSTYFKDLNTLSYSNVAIFKRVFDDSMVIRYVVKKMYLTCFKRSKVAQMLLFLNEYLKTLRAVQYVAFIHKVHIIVTKHLSYAKTTALVKE